MALRRFYVEKENLNADQLQLSGDLFHHIRDVCRFEAGDQFEVCRVMAGHFLLKSPLSINARCKPA